MKFSEFKGLVRDVYKQRPELEIEEIKNIIFNLLNINNITLNTLNKINKQIKYKLINDFNILDLLDKPYLFLNDVCQFITFNQYENICEYSNLYNCIDTMENIGIAFLYNIFNNKYNDYFIPIWKTIKKTNYGKFFEIKETCEKYNINSESKNNEYFTYDNIAYEYNIFLNENENYNNNNLIITWDVLKKENLKVIIDKNRNSKEKNNNKYYWKVKNGEYYTLKCILERHNTLNDKILEICENNNKKSYSINIINNLIEKYEKKTTTKLTKKQKKAIQLYFKTRILCLSGYPGAGKSTVANFIVRIVNELQPKGTWLICAPTGKALKNIKNKINIINDNHNYSTIHKFKYDNKGLNKCWNNIIIDESSMISFELFEDIINYADKFNSSILFIGDNDQLPPIDPGRPFKCLYNACLETDSVGYYIFLDEIKRSDNNLNTLIKKMCIKKELLIKDFDNKDLIFEEYDKFDNQGRFEKKLLSILKKYNCKINANDVDSANTSILTAQNGNNIYNKDYVGGKTHINELIQKYLHKDINNSFIINTSNNKFMINDKIIRNKNDYTKDVLRVNGDNAKIIDIIQVENGNYLIKIKYSDDNQEEDVLDTELNEYFDLCYAMTIHKKQGDEDDIIIIVISPYHGLWNTWNPDVFKLIYTAISRARKKCIIIGNKDKYESLFKQNNICTFYSSLLEIE